MITHETDLQPASGSFRLWSFRNGMKNSFWRELDSSAKAEELSAYEVVFGSLAGQINRIGVTPDGRRASYSYAPSSSGDVHVAVLPRWHRPYRLGMRRNHVRILVNEVEKDVESGGRVIRAWDYVVNLGNHSLSKTYGRTVKAPGDDSLKPASHTVPPSIVFDPSRSSNVRLVRGNNYGILYPEPINNRSHIEEIVSQRQVAEDIATVLSHVSPGMTNMPQSLPPDNQV